MKSKVDHAHAVLSFSKLTFHTFAYTLDWMLEESEICEEERRRSFMPGIKSLLPVLPLLLLYVINGWGMC